MKRFDSFSGKDRHVSEYSSIHYTIIHNAYLPYLGIGKFKNEIFNFKIPTKLSEKNCKTSSLNVSWNANHR